jgi:hypothetical protein
MSATEDEMTGEKRWVVTTSGDQSLSDIQKQLVAGGFKVDQVLTEIGVITGAAEDDVVDKVRKFAGVSDVSPDLPVDIGPPDSSVS